MNTSHSADRWLSRLLRYVRPYTLSALLATVSAMAGAALAAAIPVAEQQIVDRLNSGKFDALTGSLLVFLGLGAARFLTEVSRHYSGARMALSVQRDIRRDLVASVHRFDAARAREVGSGQILESAVRDADLVEGLLDPLPQAVGSVLMLGVSLVVMAGMSPAMTLVVVTVLPVASLSVRLFQRKILPVAQSAQRRSSDLTRMVAERVDGVDVIKTYAREDSEAAGIRSMAADVFTRKMRFVRLSGRFASFMNVVPLAGQVAVFGVGCGMVLGGHTTLGTLVAFLSFVNQMVNSSRSLTGLSGFLFDAKAGIVRAFTLIETEPALTNGMVELPCSRGAAVELDHVSFDTDTTPILDDVSLRVKAGSLTVIAGAVGSGKSTVLQLVARTFDPISGTVTVGDVDVRDLSLTSLRRSVVPVYEDPALFRGTVRDNISCGDDGVPLDDVVDAARVACAEEFVTALPGAYESVVGENGTNLSGGQRQRLALARALAREPSVLLLDNATSAMDAETSRRVHDHLRDGLAGVTRIMVTHRLDTLRAADVIHVLDRGRVVDSGLHDELVTRCAAYRELVGTDDNPNTDIPGMSVRAWCEPRW